MLLWILPLFADKPSKEFNFVSGLSPKPVRRRRCTYSRRHQLGQDDKGNWTQPEAKPSDHKNHAYCTECFIAANDGDTQQCRGKSHDDRRANHEFLTPDAMLIDEVDGWERHEDVDDGDEDADGSG